MEPVLTVNSIIDLFIGNGSTKDPSQITGKKELQKIQKDAENQKIIIDGLINNNIPKKSPGSQTKTLTTIQATIAAKNEGKPKEIAKLTATNEKIENKSSDTDAEEKSKNIDELANNSQKIDSLLGDLQEDDEKNMQKQKPTFLSNH